MSRSAEAAASLTIEQAVNLLHETGHRVLFPFHGRRRAYQLPKPETVVRYGLFIDTETTGTSPRDEIVQFAGIPFQHDADTGAIYAVGEALIQYNQPTIAVNAEALRVHGITPEMLEGKQFDAEVIKDRYTACDLILAHNMSFDRPFMDRTFGEFLPDRSHGCTLTDIPWKAVGRYNSLALGSLLMEHTGGFFSGHDAAEDCYAALHCLSAPLPDGNYPLFHVLQRLMKGSVRIYAVGGPYNVKDVLRARGYRWNDPSSADCPYPGGAKAWFKEIPVDEMDDEMAWLNAEVYSMFGSARRQCRIDEVPSHARFRR